MWVEELRCLIDRVTFETLNQEEVSNVRVWKESPKEEETQSLFTGKTIVVTRKTGYCGD